jgi:hypothetical protein
MPALSLERFQQQALAALECDLQAARLQGLARRAPAARRPAARAEPSGDTPCLCLRIPIGGANDDANPAAQDGPTRPIAGMLVQLALRARR